MLFKNKNARAVLATALAVITIIVLTLSVSAVESRECELGGTCYDDDGDGFCEKCDTVCGEHEHDYITTDYESASCTEDGFESYQCTLCLETYTEILTAGHSYRDGVCTVCGDNCSHFGTSTIVSYEDEKTHNVRCDDCGAIFYEAHTYVNGVCPCGKTGVCDGTHAWTEDPQTQVDATAHTEGWREWICQRCGESRKTIIEAEHMMQRGTHSATCTEDGYIIYTCMEGCDYEYKETIPALGGSHTWSGWQAGLVEGCDRYYTRACSACGTRDTKVEKLHYFKGDVTICACGEYTCIHDWAGSNVLSTPTCTTAGVTEYWCISCQNNGYIADKVERIEAFGHGETYWKSLGDTCAEYCGRCNEKLNTIDHYTSSDPATPCIKEYSATQIVNGHYCDRCKTYLDIQETKTTLENVLIVTIDENYGTRQQFDYDAFKTYKYIYLENKRTEYVSTFTFEVRSAKNMSVRYDAILNYIINGNDAILIDIENEQIYSHEKKHRVETVTLTGYESWKQYGDVYRAESMKQFDRYWQKGSFPNGSVFKLDIDTTIHGDIIVSNKYTADVPFLYLNCDASSQPVRMKAYNGDLSTFIDNLKKSPIKIILEYDEQTVKQFDGSALQFFRTVKTDHESVLNSNEYAQGFNDALKAVISKNPIQGLVQGAWSSFILFFTILGSGVTIGGITLSAVFSTLALIMVVVWILKLLR